MFSKITSPDGQEKILQQLDGFRGENIFDEAIRKACKLEASELSTSFNPYNLQEILIGTKNGSQIQSL